MIRFDEQSNPNDVCQNSAAPFLVTMRLLKKCTAKCLMCSFWKDQSRGMSLKDAKYIVKQCKDNNVKEICFTGGEPTAYEGFFELIYYIKSLGMNYSFITNGSLLTQDFLKKLMLSPPERIYLSIDSPNSAVHDHIRGFSGLLKRVMLGLKELDKFEARPKVIINCVISNKNYLEIPNLIKLSKGKYFDELNLMQIKGMPSWTLNFDQLLDYNQNVVPLILENLDRYNIVLRSGNPYLFGLNGDELKDSLSGVYSKEFYKKNKCAITNSMLFIETNGDIFPCNNTPYYGEAYKCGNIFEQELKAVLNSKRMSYVKKEMCGSKLCTGCDPINREINLENFKALMLNKIKGVVFNETGY